MNLTKNFTLDELCHTDTCLTNEPNDTEKDKLQFVASFLLQPIRDKFGSIKVNSGFRSEEVNKAIGGSLTSQHRLGEAADIKPLDADINDVFEWAKENLVYGQIIRESANGAEWIHISLPRRNKQNQMALRYLDGTYRSV